VGTDTCGVLRDIGVGEAEIADLLRSDVVADRPKVGLNRSPAKPATVS
jgi:hypothetical protein